MAEVQEASVNFSSANVTLVTTAETLIISAPRIAVPRQTVTALILALAQLTTGTATTGVTPQIRRGPLVTDPLVGEANVVTIGAAAGGTEQFFGFASEELVRLADVQYSLTLTQAAATGNGTALMAAILVLLL
jgi:hypothetical protein